MQQNKTNNQKKQCIVDAKISNGNEDIIQLRNYHRPHMLHYSRQFLKLRAFY